MLFVTAVFHYFQPIKALLDYIGLFTRIIVAGYIIKKMHYYSVLYFYGKIKQYGDKNFRLTSSNQYAPRLTSSRYGAS